MLVFGSNISAGFRIGCNMEEDAAHASVSALGRFQDLVEMASALGKLFMLCRVSRSLELKTSLDSITATAQFASLLINNCYYLQVLVLHLVDRDQISNTSTNSKVVAKLPIYTSNKLKYIAVFGVEGLDCELELFQLLLHSAVNLEPIVIVWKNFEHYGKGLKSVPLQAFPTVS